MFLFLRVGISSDFLQIYLLMILFLGTSLGQKMKMMYSFDFVLSKLGPSSFYSHELTFVFSPCRGFTAQNEGSPLFE